MQKLGLYIHIPFCKSKCAYCDFVSFANKDEYVSRYIDSVISESKRVSMNYSADSVFIGGGTPAYLPLGEMSRLIDGVSRNINIESDAEFTIEVNPNSVTVDKLREYKGIGANRISIGLQAAQENLLKSLGRTHTLKDYLTGVEIIRSTGIENINTDIMYALPKQTIDDLEQTLNFVDTPHISAYALKIEEGTRMYEMGVEAIDEDIDREMYSRIVNLLKNKGYNRYEISNFSKEGMECRHNIKYWNMEKYIGLGVSAHSYIETRYANTSDIFEYINTDGNSVVMNEPAGDAVEYIMLKLRMAQGFKIEEFEKFFGKQNLNEMILSADMLKTYGLLEIDENVRLTDKGFDLQDYVVINLIKNL